MRTFLLGMLAGVMLTASAVSFVSAYNDFRDLKVRVSYIEGYLGTLDKILRGTSLQADPTADSRKKA